MSKSALRPARPEARFPVRKKYCITLNTSSPIARRIMRMRSPATLYHIMSLACCTWECAHRMCTLRGRVRGTTPFSFGGRRMGFQGKPPPLALVPLTRPLKVHLRCAYHHAELADQCERCPSARCAGTSPQEAFMGTTRNHLHVFDAFASAL